MTAILVFRDDDYAVGLAPSGETERMRLLEERRIKVASITYDRLGRFVVLAHGIPRDGGLPKGWRFL